MADIGAKGDCVQGDGDECRWCNHRADLGETGGADLGQMPDVTKITGQRRFAGTGMTRTDGRHEGRAMLKTAKTGG